MTNIPDGIRQFPEPYRTACMQYARAYFQRANQGLPESQWLFWSSITYKNAGDVIHFAFAWIDTPQGTAFWSDLSQNLRKNAGNPDFEWPALPGYIPADVSVRDLAAESARYLGL